MSMDWEKRVRAYWQGAEDAAVSAVVENLVEAERSGNSSCVWHEVWSWARKNRPYPACPFCGGPADPRGGVHELCRQRSLRGMPTPRLDARPPCGCRKCSPEGV